MAPCWPDLPLPTEAGQGVGCVERGRETRRNVLSCPGCGRGFEKLQALKGHVKRCCPDELSKLTEGEEVKTSTAFARNESREGPYHAMFHLRQAFWERAWAAHAGLRRRWSECNEKLPVKAQRVLEFPPSDLWPPPQDDVVRREQYEEIALALHKKLSLVKCYDCERTFSDPEARDKHAKKCCPELMAEASREEDEDVVGRPHDLSPKCYVCGKTAPRSRASGSMSRGARRAMKPNKPSTAPLRH